MLCQPELDGVVDMVLRPVAENHYRVANSSGSIEFTRTVAGSGWDFSVLAVDGVDPLANQDPNWFLGLADEQANPFPANPTNSYPDAFARCTSVFDHASSPDLVVIHRSGHRFGAVGDHGSLAVVQSRAMCVAAGAGVPQDGLVDAHARTVDLAPTVMALLGAAPHPNGVGANGLPDPTALLARQDGQPIEAFLTGDGTAAEHVVVFLMDGLNANVAYDTAANGGAPTLAGLIERGTALRGGCLASLPTVTLANHASIMTGCEPGHHGILHNEWLDRGAGQAHNLLDPTQMFGASDHLVADIETIHEAVHRAFPNSLTATTFEYGDRGADFSTFAAMRDGAQFPIPPKAGPFPDATEDWLAESAYNFMTRIDTASTDQALSLWGSGTTPSPLPTLPTFAFFNFSLTDESAHHGGPHSPIAAAGIADTDRRIGRIIQAIDQAGKTDSTAVIVLADHGMETTSADQTAGFASHLEAAGIDAQDLGHGFLYLA